MKLSVILTALLASISLGVAEDKPAAAPAETTKPAADAPKVDVSAAFKKADTNGDGKISKEEFLVGKKDPAKAEERFKKLDKDGDGFLSLEEFSAAHAKKAK